MTKPIIGSTLDIQDPGEYSRYPWYALRENYCTAVEAAGGIPLPLPHVLEAVPRFAEMIDGLILSGGGFDIDPALYGVSDIHESVQTKPNRTQFEWALFEQMNALKKPILGICGGMQLINVALGGTLIQHIPDEAPSDLTHSQEHDRREPAHGVGIPRGTQLQAILGEIADIQVNSVHHQAVKTVPSCLRINATAPDGLVEGFEHLDHPFCIGIQWHPEFHVTEHDRSIFNAFIKAASPS